MRLIAILIVIGIVLGVILVPQIFFVVDETQQAIVTRFGEPRMTFKQPGIKTKLPFVEKVNYFEKRLMLFDAPPEGLLTKDKKTGKQLKTEKRERNTVRKRGSEL